MRTTWIIARKELASFFDSLIAYVLLVVFLVLSGLFTWLVEVGYSTVFVGGEARLDTFFSWSYWLLALFIPGLTMGTIAEEKKSGTIDLLLTKAVTDWQVVFGKFLACCVLIAVALLATLPYYITIIRLGAPDHGAVLCGYLALFLMSAAYIAIGIFISSATRDQMVAFLLTFLVIAVFHLVVLATAGNSSGLVGTLLTLFSTGDHFDSMSRGVVDSRDLLFFGSIIVLGLSFAEVNLARRLISGK